PDYLAQPITKGTHGAELIEQTAHIQPKLDGAPLGYFDWIGAARFRADVHAGAMHGKQFLLHTGYAGTDERFLFARLDFAESVEREGHLTGDFEIAQSIECLGPDGRAKETALRLIVTVRQGKKESWRLQPADDPRH